MAPAAVMAEATPRLGWLDLARGLSMVLVVLLHADLALLRVGGNDPWLHQANMALIALRLPLFFLVSGLLGASILAAPLGEVLRRRVALYLWLLVLWWGLHRGFDLAFGEALGPLAMHPFFEAPPELGTVFLVGQDGRWFLYALAMFFTLGWVLRHCSPPVHAALALMLGALGAGLVGSRLGVPALDRLYYYPYFAAGLLAGAPLRRWAPRLGRFWAVLVLAPLFTAAARFALRHDPHLGDRTLALLSAVALPLGLAVACWLAARGGPLATALTLVGRHTLPIYILHIFLLRLLFAAVVPPAWLPPAAWTLAAAALSVVGALHLGRWLAPLPGLFRLPLIGARPAPAPAARPGSPSPAGGSTAR